MSDPRDILNGATPVRRVLNLRATPDAESGKTTVITNDEQSISLSPEQSVDSINLAHDHFYKCYCSAAEKLGGRCYVCHGTSCARCHGHCSVCHKPICPEHSVFIQAPSGQHARLCGACHQILRRKRQARTILRGLLSPFVAFDKEER
jgi:hypothetical protein